MNKDIFTIIKLKLARTKASLSLYHIKIINTTRAIQLSSLRQGQTNKQTRGPAPASTRREEETMAMAMALMAAHNAPCSTAQCAHCVHEMMR